MLHNVRNSAVAHSYMGLHGKAAAAKTRFLGSHACPSDIDRHLNHPLSTTYVATYLVVKDVCRCVYIHVCS